MANTPEAENTGLRNSLRSRMAIWIAALACLFALAGAGISLAVGFSLLDRDFQRNVRSHMQLASISLKAPVRQIDYLELRDQVQAILDYQGITGVRIMDHNREILLEDGEFTRTILQEDIISGQETLGYIEVSFSRDSLLSNMLFIVYTGLGLLLLLVPGFIFLIWRLSGYYLQDLSYLTRCIRENTCQELPQYPGLQRKDEVGLLAWALKHRDQDLTRYHLELDTYKNHLEDMVEKRTHELKRSQMLKQTILNSIPDAIALVNAADLTIQDINTAFLERFGLERSQVLGRHCYNIMYGYQAPCHHYDLLCPINEYVQHGKPCITEHRHYNHKNEIIHVEVAAWPVFEENGHVEQLVHVSRDITQKKKVEELREDVERIVRHDLKTPLNGVIGMAELLIEDEDMNSEQREFAGHILESGRNMLHMINHSLDLYKMEEGTYQMRPESFDLQELLQHLRQETSRIRKYKDLQLNFLLNGEPLEEDRQIPVLGEKTNIQSMLANLITNAIEAAPESSQVTVSIQQYAEYMHIDIHNYGTVPEEIRERFFERYATSGKTKGTGLGTFSARLIARSHGGDIDFSTSEDKGTHVRVKLPLNLYHQLDRTADIVQ